MSIREQINAAIKAAMIAKDKPTLQTLRILSAAFKQIEIDQQIEVTDEVVTRELVRQVKQRQESAKQFRAAEREELALKEDAEIEIIQRFLPEQLTEVEIKALVDKCVADSGLDKSMQSMGALMGKLKPELEGRADMAAVSAYLRQVLQS